MKIKVFSCILCRKKGKRYLGTRHVVRQHLQEEHWIKSNKYLARGVKNENYRSPVTAGLEEFKE